MAGEVIACLAGEQAGTAPNPVQPLRDRQYRLLRRCLEQIYPPAKEFELPPDDDTIVCRCEEVTAGEIRRVAALGCSGPNQGKAFTRCGMGPCMGPMGAPGGPWEPQGAQRISKITTGTLKLQLERLNHNQGDP